MTAPFPIPAQADPLPPLRHQRARGAGRLSVKWSGGASRIDRLFQEGSARIRLPRVVSGHPLEAVLINTAGGLTGGDRMDWHFEAGSGTAVSLTTQACEKTYKASDEVPAEVSTRLIIGEAASLSWLPQETILFDHAALSRRFEIDLAGQSRLLMVEPVVFGRLAMGERMTSGRFQDRWRIRMGGRLVHAEDFRIGPDIAAMLGRAAGASGGRAMATVLMIAPDAADRLDAVRRIVGSAGGASAFALRRAGTGKLLARIIADDSYSLRKSLVPLIGLLNEQAGLPKIWSL
ncbi:urease accessory protein [Hoeflea marina]|uniref:Urease accessory protein UreD n=1 Tax=Hoeflea marina TaxID=274592 RepID=A0A317PMJ0_9HYPH|nr:urease accessory protein UreD [Hoeflea marina]PWW01733.1 urease accessory protein [Hoeflea marina]